MISGFTGGYVETLTLTEIEKISKKLSKIVKNTSLMRNSFNGYYITLNNKEEYLGYNYDTIIRNLNKIISKLRKEKIKRVS